MRLSCGRGAQFVVGLGDKVAPTDIEEGMRVGCAPHAWAAAMHGIIPPGTGGSWPRGRTACPERRAATAAATSRPSPGASSLPGARRAAGRRACAWRGAPAP